MAQVAIMEFYEKNSFDFDEDTTDTEDDSGIAEVSSSVDYANDHTNLDSDTTPGEYQQLSQPQDALGRFFSYW